MHRRIVFAIALALSACGAGDRMSDVFDPNPPRCPTLEEIAPTFLRLLREDRFDGLRRVLEDDLGEPLDARNPNGPTRLNALLGVILEVIRAVDVPGFRQVILDALESTSAGPLLPQAEGLLSYIDGRIGCPAGTSCDRYDLLDVLRRLLVSGACGAIGFDARTELDLLARFVKWPRLPELLDLFPTLLENPTFRSVLGTFRYQDREQEDGFAALLDIVLDNLLVPGIPWQDIVSLLRQVRLDTPEVLRLIDFARELLTESPADPDLDVIGPMRAAIRCLRQVDPGRALARNLYRVLVLDEVSLEGLAGGIDRLLDADPQRLTLKVLAQALDHFRTRALSSFRTLQAIGDVLLSTENMRKIVPVLIDVIREGVAEELVDLFVAVTDDCTRLAR